MEYVNAAIELMPIIGLIAFAAVLTLLAVVALHKLWNFRRICQQRYIFLELTPPASVTKETIATQELFSSLHGLHDALPMKDKLLRRKLVFSLEIVSSKHEGIRFMARVPQTEAEAFQQSITAYLPEMRIKQVPSPSINSDAKIIEFKQTGHFAFPLNVQETLSQHDSVAYLTSAMAKLKEDEQIIFQMVLSPTRVRETDRIAQKILRNEDVLGGLSRYRMPGFHSLLSGINSLLFSLADGFTDAISPPSHKIPHTSSSRDPLASQKQQAAMRLRPARVLSAFEQELVESMHHKISQPIFRVNLRVSIAVQSKAEKTHKAKGIRTSLALFNVHQYQSLKPKHNFPAWIKKYYRRFVFAYRLPSLLNRNTCLFSTSELAGLYHFPHSSTTKTEGIVTSLSRTLPAPLSLKSGGNFDVVLGNNNHHGTITPIGLTAQERERHVYIIGGTGNGKTTMLLYAISQDVKNGKGIAIVDPHGDLAETILRHVPEERMKDVVYFNPDDLERPIGMNLLELAKGLKGDELLREKDLITEAVVSVFRKIFSDDDSGGHRIEYILRNTVQTALTQEGATLFTVYDLINDPKYRKKVTATLEDEHLKNFWQQEFGKAGDYQRVKMAAGITAKIGRFLFSASAKRILEQPQSTIDFDDIINNGKILICNFSKGVLGEDTSELFGVTVLTKLQLASLRRARIKQAERQPFHLYVDEFQNFATPSFVQMLSESRKYKLLLTMAEQSTSQQDDQQMVNIILANVGTVVCFRTGNPADERAVLPMFTPHIEAGEIANLAAFNYYMRIAAIHSQEPLSGETALLDNDGDEETAAKIIEYSRKKFAVGYKKVEQQQTTKKSRTTAKKSFAKEKRALPGANK